MVRVCVDLRECRPWFLNVDPPDFSPKKVNDRRSLPSSETNGGMDWSGAQSRKFATTRVNLQISQLFSIQPCQEAQEAQHRKQQFFDGFRDICQILKISSDFLNCRASVWSVWWSQQSPSRLRSLEPWLTFNFPQIHFVCFPTQVYCVFFIQWMSLYFLWCFFVPLAEQLVVLLFYYATLV